jgi:hypothetical protein
MLDVGAAYQRKVSLPCILLSVTELTMLFMSFRFLEKYCILYLGSSLPTAKICWHLPAQNEAVLPMNSTNFLNISRTS